MRQISFFHTTEQIRSRTKTVTRRAGWKELKVGDQLQAVVKCQGIKKGDKIEPLAVIEVTNIRREPLNMIEQADCVAEGFPDMTPAQFIAFYCESMAHQPSWDVTRIEFKYI